MESREVSVEMFVNHFAVGLAQTARLQLKSSNMETTIKKWKYFAFHLEKILEKLDTT